MAHGVDEIVRLRAAEEEALTQVTEARECAWRCGERAAACRRRTQPPAQTAR